MLLAWRHGCLKQGCQGVRHVGKLGGLDAVSHTKQNRAQLSTYRWQQQQQQQQQVY